VRRTSRGSPQRPGDGKGSDCRMTYKIRKIRPTKKPVPLPEALPGRGDKSWEIEEAPAGRAHCKYSEEGSSTLAVPLEDTPCEKCGKNHNAAARLHELAHA